MNSEKNVRIFEMVCSAVILCSCTSVQPRTDDFSQIAFELNNIRSVENVDSLIEYDIKLSNHGSRALCASVTSRNIREPAGFSIDIFDDEGRSVLSDNQGFPLNNTRINVIIQPKRNYIFHHQSFLDSDLEIADIHSYLIRMDMQYCGSGREVVIYRRGIL